MKKSMETSRALTASKFSVAGLLAVSTTQEVPAQLLLLDERDSVLQHRREYNIFKLSILFRRSIIASPPKPEESDGSTSLKSLLMTYELSPHLKYSSPLLFILVLSVEGSTLSIRLTQRRGADSEEGKIRGLPNRFTLLHFTPHFPKDNITLIFNPHQTLPNTKCLAYPIFE